METPTLDLLMSYAKPMGRKEGKEELLSILNSLDNFHLHFKVLHVAGTAGKGSTSAMLAQGLQEAGKKVGLLTSPHLLSVTERIKVNGKEISLEKMEELASFCYKKNPHLRFSEYMTLIALLYFKEEKIDYFVCEAFMGGEYDTSNIFTPLLTILTSIGHDHEIFLGKTKEEILHSELGICQRKVPLFTRMNSKLVENYCKEKEIPLHLVSESTETNLEGLHQEENAGLAKAALLSLDIKEEVIEHALQKVSWKGRLEYLEKNILLDCAHNDIGMNALKEYLNKQSFRRLIILFAMTKKKNFERDFHPLLFRADHVIYTKTKMFNAAEPKEYAPKDSEIFESVGEAYGRALQLLGGEDLLLVCGSVYLVAEVLKIHEDLN